MSFVGDAFKCSSFVMVVIVIVYMLLSKAAAVDDDDGDVTTRSSEKSRNHLPSIPSSMSPTFKSEEKPLIPIEPSNRIDPETIDGFANNNNNNNRDELYEFVVHSSPPTRKEKEKEPKNAGPTGLSSMSLFGDGFAAV